MMTSLPTPALQCEERTKDLEKALLHPVPALNNKEWTSPKDTDDAQSWPLSIKIYHTIIPSAIGFLITFSATVYLPGVQDVSHKFQVSNLAAIVPFSLFVLGYAFGPIIAAPCSETFGRRLVYWTSIPCFAVFILASGLSQNLASLIIFRFLAGLFGSPGLIIGSGTVADIWKPEERTIPMTAFVAAPFVGPTMGALIGGFVVEEKGWRWTQWTALFLAVAIYVPSLFIRETYKKVILSRRARRKSLAPPPCTHSLSQTSKRTARHFITVTLTRPLHMLFTEPIVGLLSLYIAFTFAIVYAFYAAIPWIFTQVYGFSTASQGIVFLSLTIGYVASIATIILTTQAQKKRRRNTASNENGGNAILAPEESLLLAMLGGPSLPVALFLFGWSAKAAIHWIVPVVAITLYGWGTLLVFMGSTMYIMNTYGPLYGASAIAANRFSSYLLAVAFPLFAIQMYSSLGIAWASSLLGFIAAALAPVPWVFFRYGPTLRKKSRYDKELREPRKARLREGCENEMKTPNGKRQLEF